MTTEGEAAAGPNATAWSLRVAGVHDASSALMRRALGARPLRVQSRSARSVFSVVILLGQGAGRRRRECTMDSMSSGGGGGGRGLGGVVAVVRDRVGAAPEEAGDLARSAAGTTGGG